MSAAIFPAFVLIALALTWTTPEDDVFWIASTIAAATSLALMIAAQTIAPFFAAIVIIAMAAEVAHHRRPSPLGRLVAAIAVDLASASLLYIYLLDAAARVGYTPLSDLRIVVLICTPFVLYLATTTIDAAWHDRRISIFDFIQTTLTFFCVAYGAIHFGGSHRKFLGLTFVVLAGALYAMGIISLNRFRSQRSFSLYATWGAAALVLGSAVSLGQTSLACILATAAIASVLIGSRNNVPVLEIHGAAFLFAAAYVSGLFSFDRWSVIGPSFPTLPWVTTAVLVTSILCYSLTIPHRHSARATGLSRLTLAAIAAVSCAAMTTYLLARMANAAHALSGVTAIDPFVLLQTVCLCSTALCLAAAGARLRLLELSWLAYTMVLLTAAKILLNDVRQQTVAGIAITFLCFAGALILVPRLSRKPDQPISPFEQSLNQP